jgi:hypothetical protein
MSEDDMKRHSSDRWRTGSRRALVIVRVGMWLEVYALTLCEKDKEVKIRQKALFLILYIESFREFKYSQPVYVVTNKVACLKLQAISGFRLQYFPENLCQIIMSRISVSHRPNVL